MSTHRDDLLADALALVRAQASGPGRNLDGFAELLNSTDCMEHHKLILRLCVLVEIAATPTVGSLDDLARCADAWHEKWGRS